MLRRSTKIQLILFVIITLVGISYVSAEYVGLTKFITSDGCSVYADFENSGGIFTNAEVTYRGVAVGQVGQLKIVRAGQEKDLPDGGIQVELKLDSCSSPRIPADSAAEIHNRSVVGEQYVDLVPENGVKGGPYLVNSNNIPASRNSTPVPTQNLLLHLNQLIESVPLNALRTTVTELGNAVTNRGDDLRTLLDSFNSLLTTADRPDNLSATLQLIRDSSTVLQTQLDESDNLRSWTHSLNLLSQQLKSSDPDIRRLLDDGPSALSTVNSFIKDNQTDFGATLANLATTGNVVVRHLGGLEEVLELYPALAAGGQAVVQPGQRRAKLGLVLQSSPEPQDCGDPAKGQQGYNGTVRRTPDQLAPIAPNVSVRCTAAVSTGTNIRGSAHVPGGDPISLGGGGYAYPRVITKNTLSGVLGSTVSIGSIGGSSTGTAVNDGRYLTLLTESLG